MALATRIAGMLPLAGAVAGAVALAGVAVFTVAQAGCASPGQYVEHDGQLELVGSCLDPHKLPPAPIKQNPPAQAEPASLSP